MKKITKTIFGEEIIYILSRPQFLTFILSVIFSQIAINMLIIVLIFQLFFLTSSNFLSSLLIIIFTLPQIILGFIGGIIADVRDKRSILMHGNLLRAMIIFFLFLNSTSIPIIYVITFIVSIVTQFYTPAETPIIPKLVEKKHLTIANSIFGVALFGSVLIGYVLAGSLIDIFGRANVFLFLSFLFLISSIFIYFLPTQAYEGYSIPEFYILTRFRQSLQNHFKNTLQLVKDTEGVIIAFFFLAFSQIIILILASIIPGYAKSILGVPAESLSLIVFGPAALGMIVSSFLIGRFFSKINKGKLMNIGLFISAFVLCLFPFTSKIVARDFIQTLNFYLPRFLEITTIHFAMTLSFLAGFANALIFIPSQTLIQDKIPEIFRSKVYGLLFSLIGVFSLIPIVLTGGVADLFGVGTVLFIIGAIIFIVGILRLAFFSGKLIKIRKFL